jgi:hypothetical protein
MQFTCRQLHNETSMLLPTTSRLIFPLRKVTTEAASVLCARLLRNVCMAGITQIDVQERIPDRARAFWKRLFDVHGLIELVETC